MWGEEFASIFKFQKKWVAGDAATEGWGQVPEPVLRFYMPKTAKALTQPRRFGWSL